MDRFPEELLYILVFVGIVLFNAVQAMRRRQRQAEAPSEAPLDPPPEADEPLEDIWGRTPAPAVPPPALAPPRPQALPSPGARRRLHPVRALLKDPRGLRQAVVLMMVLGPCRSQDPPEG